MKKCLVIPDSFKGTMTSMEICCIMTEEIKKHFPECEVISVPIADGGEGTVDCFLQALGGVKVSINAKGPHFEDIDTFYGMIGKTAVIEMAAVVGLSKAKGNVNPAKTTTFGIGQLIEDAVMKGCSDIVLGLGGCCTNDVGVGAAAALGTKFYNNAEEIFIPTGETLSEVKRIDISDTRKLLKGTHLTVMCDVDNPLFGKNGTAYVFAKQKGADEKMVKMLDNQLITFSDTIQSSLQIDISTRKGAGAGGGMGAGAEVFLGADMKKGIDMILDMIEFEKILDACDMIFTGEGRIDKQSLGGKAVIGISRRAMEKNVPVVAIVGEIGAGFYPAYAMGVSAIFSTNHMMESYGNKKTPYESNLRLTMNNVMNLINIIEGHNDKKNSDEKTSKQFHQAG